MTPQDLIAQLDTVSQDAPLIFVTENGPINAGYHVTEVKLASVQSLDCGARRSSWNEVVIQLLDGSGQDFMTAGKFTGILKKATSKLEGLDHAALKFEFSNDNKGLRILEPGHPVAADHLLKPDVPAASHTFSALFNDRRHHPPLKPVPLVIGGHCA